MTYSYKLTAGGPFTLEQIESECAQYEEDLQETLELYEQGDPEEKSVFYLVVWKWREGFSHRWITVYQKDHRGWWNKFMLMDNTGFTHTIECHLRDVYLKRPDRVVAAASSSSSTSVIPGSKRDPNRENKLRPDYMKPVKLDFNSSW